MEQTLDYYKLGETTGKAWRLGHMGEPVREAGINAREDLHIMEGTHEADSFYKGFNTGVAAVDENAAHHVEDPPLSSLESRVRFLERIARSYQVLGADTSFEAFEERHRLEHDVYYYFNTLAQQL